MQEQINEEQQRLREQLQFKQAEIAAKQVGTIICIFFLYKEMKILGITKQ
jgi:hypothetical protein